MGRYAFFSFHYQVDIWRVSQVRNSWVTKGHNTAGFWDAADWESVKRGGERAIVNWIEDQLSGTSVTVVLVGAETAQRKYVNYEIQRSHELGKGLLAVRIHQLKDQSGLTSMAGPNPFDGFTVTDSMGRQRRLSSVYQIYDWVQHDGYNQFANWVESAAAAAGR